MKRNVAGAFCQDDHLFLFFLNENDSALAGLQSPTLPLAQSRWDSVTATLDPAGKRATENLWISVKLSEAAAFLDLWPASRLKLFLFFVKQTDKRKLNHREPPHLAATVYTAQQLDGFSVRY